MLRLICCAALLVGCAPAPVANAPIAPGFVLAPAPESGVTPESVDPSLALSAVRSPSKVLPRSGSWEIRWRLGDEEYTDTYELAFEPAGSVVVADVSGDFQNFPDGLAGDRIRFDGAVRPEIAARNMYSREKFDLQVDSKVRLSGTRSIRVNFRWVSMPATATFKAAVAKMRG